MARGTSQKSPPLSSLPKVSFQKIEDDVSTQPCGVHDGQARAFGYNDFSEFQRPDSYIRHIEPLESELAKQVEYDMDEQDKEWLDTLNRERKKEQHTQISYELFEVIMDRLEKEWFDLTKNIPKPDFALPSEDSTCAICDDSEGENSNAIVFCDGCNLAVHQDCYGVPYIPEGQWLCRKCTVSPENPVSCLLCPNEGGAFKQTVHGEWVHLLCAIWVPETRVANEVFMEPITGVQEIKQARWRLKCSICGDIRRGACIQCSKASCAVAFHATCARKEKLLLPMKSAHGAEPVSLTSYCDRHLPKEQQDARAKALAAEEALDDDPGHSAKLAKSARAYAKTYKLGPPLVPAIIVSRIDYYVQRFKISKRLPTIHLMCRYWSLKREARRGAPLLKRLHLEPWTASAGGRIQTDEEKIMKLDQLKRLLYDMECLRDLTNLTKKRERWKLEQTRALYNVLENSIFPHEKHLRAALERIMAHDRQGYFKDPVSKVDVPDYFDIIKRPMCWTMIENKIDQHEYWDLKDFTDDVDLVTSNAIMYNKPGTTFHKTAFRIQAAIAPIIEELRQLTTIASHKNEDDATASDDRPSSPVGDLEPPLELLELLMSNEAIQDEMDLVLEEDTPLASLFGYSLPRFKTPPPPPPPPPPKPPKIKRDRRANNTKKKRSEAIANASSEATHPAGTEMVHTSEQLEPEHVGAEIHGNETPVEEQAGQMQQQGPSQSESVPESDGLIGPGRRGRQRKRAMTSLPGPAELLPLVESVDNQQSFKMFNRGWILPPEQKRGGRAPVDKQVTSFVSRPKKKMRTDDGPSRLSVLSSTASDGQTLREGSSAKIDFPINDENAEHSQPSQETLSQPRSASRSQFAAPSNPRADYTVELPPPHFVHMENGTVVVEELDTPFIRRQKTWRKKEEKRRLAQLALMGPGTPGTGAFNVPQAPSSSASGSRDNLQPQEGGSENDPTGDSTPPGKPPPEPGLITLDDGAKLEGGTLVWAKAGTFPWWPAVVFERNDPMVPPNVLQACLDHEGKRKSSLHIVRFFEKNLKNQTWQHLPADRLRLLGEDKGLDEDMLAAKSTRQKWRSASSRESCLDQYKAALSEMETSSDLAANEGKFEEKVEEEKAVEEDKVIKEQTEVEEEKAVEEIAEQQSQIE